MPDLATPFREAKAGNSQALDELVDLLQEREEYRIAVVVASILRIGSPGPTLEDVARDVRILATHVRTSFTALFSQADTLSSAISLYLDILRDLSWATLITRARRVAKTEVIPIAVPITTGLKDLADMEASVIDELDIERVKESLPLDARQVVNMALEDGRSLKEISLATGKSQARVRAILQDVIRRLRAK